MRRLDDTTILFDWNGTIVLDADRARSALNGVLKARTLPQLEPGDFAERFRLPMRDLFLDLEIPEHQLGDAEAEWNRGMLQGEPVTRSGAATALLSLAQRGARLGVISAASAATITADHRRMGLPDVWDCVRGGVSDKVRALREERSDRPRAVYVGDTAYDMLSAREAGYRAVGVSGGYSAPSRLRHAGAEEFIADISDLVPLLEGPLGSRS